MSLVVTTPIDYPACSSKILNVNVDSKGFSDDYTYRIFGDLAFGNSVKTSTDRIRYGPYFELLFPISGSSEYNVYSNFDCQNTINTNDGAQLLIKNPNVVINDKRFWTVDRLIQVSSSAPSGVNSYINVKFKQNPKLKATFKFTAQVLPSNGEYSVSQVTRQTIWVYNPQTPVYLLINTSGSVLSIYVMQSYTNQVYSDLNQTNLPYLGSRMDIPKGWTFAYIILDIDTYLKVVSTETAYLVQDSAKNSYQYLDPLYAPWLYEQYAYLNVV